jgi:hypothetical protein
MGMLDEEFQVFARQMTTVHADDGERCTGSENGVIGKDGTKYATQADVHVIMVPEASGDESTRTVRKIYREFRSDAAGSDDDPVSASAMGLSTTCDSDGVQVEIDLERSEAPPNRQTVVQRIEFRVTTGEEVGERVLVVSSEGGSEHRIPIPVNHTVSRIHGAGKTGIAMSELQRAFNRMSRRLAELEAERET